MALSMKQWRRAKGFSQEEMAEMLDVSTSTIRNWEKYPKTVPAVKIVLFAQKLDLTLEQIDIFCLKEQ